MSDEKKDTTDEAKPALNIGLYDSAPIHTFVFYSKGGKKVGEFDFSVSPATFIGDVDASAQIFVDAVLCMWNGEIKQRFLAYKRLFKER